MAVFNDKEQTAQQGPLRFLINAGNVRGLARSRFIERIDKLYRFNDFAILIKCSAGIHQSNARSLQSMEQLFRPFPLFDDPGGFG